MSLLFNQVVLHCFVGWVVAIDAVDELKEPGYSNTTDETENDAEVKELFEHDKS